ncbi:hypothetical protein Cyagr_0257 [Cyanobium gracile PCC 6307]|uniref:Uncharacterized protein n=1 Tax=Cyanobium gracile (strain ATCC 27147 / PCC 6307) TaxID=292564 RepID=K9P3B0_CYAGP|nr:hypothetical protein Cyagr_0257 [Cyanobium gracile PCC 6307]
MSLYGGEVVCWAHQSIAHACMDEGIMYPSEAFAYPLGIDREDPETSW